MLSSEPEDKNIHICKFCDKQFNGRKNLWKHLNTKKTSCIQKEKVEQLYQKTNMQETQINYFEKKTKTLEEQTKEQQEEIDKLKQQLLLIKKEQSIETLVDSKLEKLGDEIINKIDENNGRSNFFSAQNQYIITNNTNNKMDLNIDQRHGNFFDLHLNESGKERLDHIDKNLMMKILNAKTFPKSMGKLIASIYFHPKAPENYKWCVTDITAATGALQYSSETGTLYLSNTNETISKNVKNVMFGVTDVLTELSRSKSFNDNQAINYSKIVNLMGNELSDSCIHEIKETAYQHRHFPRTAWKYMNIPIATEPVLTQQKLTHM